MKTKGKTWLLRWIFMNSTQTTLSNVFNDLSGFVSTYQKWGSITLQYAQVSAHPGAVQHPEDSDILSFVLFVGLDHLKCESAEEKETSRVV